MKIQKISQGKRQKGAILIVALLFLIVITLLTLSSMQSSNLGLRMSQNDESRLVAQQSAQAIADFIISNPTTTPVTGNVGFSVCTAFEKDCVKNDIVVDNTELAAAVSAKHLSARVQRTAPEFRPPPRMLGSSVDKFTSASFRVTSTYDRSSETLGNQRLVEGIIVLVPVY